jgi:septal ring factor EnvC (AmiA/AmiB activator)
MMLAQAQASVRSPWHGRVVYAGVISGYGHLIVVDHGERVHTVLGYLGGISIKPGALVKPGSVVGYLDKSGQLYVEIRKDARPQDAMKWLRLNS